MALHRVGPYHQVRLSAAVDAGLRLTVVQTRPQSQEYAWDFDPAGPYALTNLIGASHPDKDPSCHLLVDQINTLLDRFKPQVIVSVGWADRAYQVLLLLAHQRRIPVVLVSDSRERDEPRTCRKEWLKRQLLRGYSAALVAGEESRAYLAILGFCLDKIFLPWDVVDNAFFADAASQCTPQMPHFLCVSRLVAKKNHIGLLQAYSAYQRQGGCWGLQLVGSGPEELAIRHSINELPNPERVELKPFCQLDTLGVLYGQANAFILASHTDQWGLVVNEAMASGLPCLVSNACGCTRDLIQHGVTGWCFDPMNPGALTELMHVAERQPKAMRVAMVTAARRRLRAFTPQAFATGLQQACEQAIARPRFSRRAALTASLLCRRP